MCRKYAQDFLRSLDLKSPEDFAAHTLEWSALGKAKRAGNRAIADLIDRLNDGCDQKRAAEIEAATDAVATIVQTADQEMDDRTEIGDRSARADPIAAMRPQFENLISPAVDGNPLGQIEAEPYSLRSDQSMRAWAQPRQDNRFASLSTGRYFKTLLCGASNDTEARALSEGTDSQGGFTTPAPVALNLIDQLRANSVVNQAGATTIPLTSDSQTIAKLASDPTPAFRAENAAVAESDPTFANVTMTPRSMAVLIKVSRELMQDSVNLESELPRILAVAMAKELDRICLLGSGSAPEPRGVANQSGIGTIALNAALTNYSSLISAKTAIETANAGPVTAFVMHPRESGDLATLADSTGQPLRVPPALEAIPMLGCSAIPINTGAGSNESVIFAGNFRHLLIGMRTQIRVEVARELFAANHQTALIAHCRFDVQLAHPAAFYTITDVQS
jgi:HK97 family phage major capsid protein